MKLGYTIIYVADVPQTVTFYETAFGLPCRCLHDSQTYAELETGATALAFAALDAIELNGLAVSPNSAKSLAAAWEICLVTEGVASAYQTALNAGCSPVVPPTEKPWGQTVAYVRDLNGCLVELATPIT